jgi:hypothetical protein
VIHVDGTGRCPTDPNYHHEFYYGCVPVDFSLATGRSKSAHQTKTDIGLPWPVWLWPGGCDASGVTARRKTEEYARQPRKEAT